MAAGLPTNENGCFTFTDLPPHERFRLLVSSPSHLGPKQARGLHINPITDDSTVIVRLILSSPRLGMAPQPYFPPLRYGRHAIPSPRLAMKMTMHIDEGVLRRVMQVTGAKTKTEAVELALNEMARRHKLKELFTAGLGLTPDQLKAEFAPGPADALDSHGLMAAEDQPPYGQPRSS